MQITVHLLWKHGCPTFSPTMHPIFDTGNRPGCEIHQPISKALCNYTCFVHVICLAVENAAHIVSAIARVSGMTQGCSFWLWRSIAKSVWFIKIRAEWLWTYSGFPTGVIFYIQGISSESVSSRIHSCVGISSIRETDSDMNTSEHLLAYILYDLMDLLCTIQGVFISVTSGLLHQPFSHYFLLLHWEQEREITLLGYNRHDGKINIS